MRNTGFGQVGQSRGATPSGGERVARLARTALGMICAPLAVLFALGMGTVLLPQRPGAAVFLTVSVAYALIAAGIGLALGLALGRLGARWFGRVTALASALALLFCAIQVLGFWREARAHDVALSLRENFDLALNSGEPNQSRSRVYANVEGQDLLLEVLSPPAPAIAPRPAVVWVHGGGWAGGTLGMTPLWTAWLTARGYVVFDIDYRLAPPPRWDQAPTEVRCAVAWVKANAADYGVDPRRVALAGGSAGGNLALNAAYTAPDAPLPAGCAAADSSVVAVAAIHPITDAAAWWGSELAAGRHFTEPYTGGTPGQFPDRYAAISPLRQVRPGLPPTLLAHGTVDDIVPYAQSPTLAAALVGAAVPCTLVTLPFTGHGYDLFWNSLGTQLTRQTFAAFLDRHLAPIVALAPPPPPLPVRGIIAPQTLLTAPRTLTHLAGGTGERIATRIGIMNPEV